ncbi:DotU family type IV/VI secretion system protein [Desulfobacula sp.]|uniref:DotU family type IV/VI secretion system protein n=1 Tax=Desulfobacula sp. TaxID=2593537 RepID=UPI00261ECD1C|nr:DotU family type IV/VI secretion system protein [Desulfobacula sp.]
MKISSVDCVTELLAYTYHLVDQLQTQSVEYDQVSNNYHQLIQRAKLRAKSAGIPKDRFAQALFAIFAWVDETILETGWKQKNEWIKNSLQKKIYNTTSAGTEFFAEIEKFGPDDKDILEVYDYCLASGFKGCLYKSYHQEKLDGIKINIRKKITDGGDFDTPDILFPEAGDIEFSKRLKRKRWKGLSNFSSILVLFPILLFLMLYYFFNERLIQMVNDSGLLL